VEKIQILADQHPTGSVQSVAELLKGLLEPTYAVTICNRLKDLHSSYATIVLQPRDYAPVSELGRFVGLGKVVYLYSAHPAGTAPHKLAPQLLCGPTTATYVFPTPYVQTVLTAMARKILAPARIRNASLRSSVIPYCIDPRFKPRNANDPSVFLAPFNRVDRTFKGFNEHLDFTTKFGLICKKPSFHDFRHGDADYAHLDELPEGHPYVLTHQGTREDYIEHAQSAGFFFCAASKESFGLMYLELLNSGCIGIFLDKPWVHSLLPGYPYVTTSVNSAIEMALHMRDNYQETVVRFVEWQREKDYAKMYSATTVQASWLKLLAEPIT
jgi:hypothetical protein